MTSAPSTGRKRIALCVSFAAAIAPAGAAFAQEPPPPRQETRNLYGMTGLIDMPSARMQPDGEMGVTSSYFGGFMRNTLTFQALPRVEVAFRYSVIQSFFPSGEDLFDRSFDISILLSDETPYFPAVVVGLRDFLGTGVYSSEYLVATKSITDEVQVSGGLGWGRLADAGTLRNPLGYLSSRFDNRSSNKLGTGKVNFGEFFRGPDVGVFGGVEYRPDWLEGLSLKVEYSTDEYLKERRGSSFDPAIPFNFGAAYQVNDWLTLGAYAMYGTEFGLRASIGINPNRPPAPLDAGVGPTPLTPRPPVAEGVSPDLGPVVERLGPGPAPGSDAAVEASLLAGATEGARWAQAPTGLAAGSACPVETSLDVDAALGVVDGVTFLDRNGAPLCSVVLRPEGRRYTESKRVLLGGADAGWARNPAAIEALDAALAKAIDGERVEMLSADITATRARVEIRNPIFNAAPQAVGRTARAMANTLPPSVEDFEITLVESDLPTATVILRRARLEQTVDTADAVRTSWLDADIVSAEPWPGSPLPEFDADRHPSFSWFLTPALPVNLFDPDSPLRADLQLLAGASVGLARGLSMNGEVAKSLINGFDDIERSSNSKLPHVRSDFAKYYQEGDPGLQRLTGDYLFKLTPETYGRVSVGYLETMFGGVSGEVLWKPAEQNWGLGAELNYVKQRDFDMRFGFQDYDVVTGHASVYWDTGWHGMEAQVDAGRYLAGDWGATFSLTRRFSNGWEVGGFFTLTDVPFDEYGEGSFDKGIRLTIPFAWGLPFETRNRFTSTIRPLTRDGGARLYIANRLYPIVQEMDRGDLRADWGHFWQ